MEILRLHNPNTSLERSALNLVAVEVKLHECIHLTAAVCAVWMWVMLVCVHVKRQQ